MSNSLFDIVGFMGSSFPHVSQVGAEAGFRHVLFKVIVFSCWEA